jgi:hypothetical protein
MPLEYKNCSFPIEEFKFDMFFINLSQNIDQLLEKYYVFITRPRLFVLMRASYLAWHWILSFEYKEAVKFAAYEKKSRRRKEMYKKNVNIYKKSWEFAVLKVHKHEIISIYFLT